MKIIATASVCPSVYTSIPSAHATPEKVCSKEETVTNRYQRLRSSNAGTVHLLLASDLQSPKPGQQHLSPAGSQTAGDTWRLTVVLWLFFDTYNVKSFNMALLVLFGAVIAGGDTVAPDGTCSADGYGCGPIETVVWTSGSDVSLKVKGKDEKKRKCLTVNSYAYHAFAVWSTPSGTLMFHRRSRLQEEPTFPDSLILQVRG